MRKKHVFAFTLVELIVVITILAILWTIAFVSLSWYSQKARNSSRVSDVKVIEKGLSLFMTTNSAYPRPDNAIDISYSGSLAWSQWTFWSWVYKELKTVSNIPTDPLFWTQYTYSVLNTKNQYELAAMLEGGLQAFNPSISQSYAVSSTNASSFNVWTYISRDIKVSTGGECIFITSPSIILSDIPTWGNMVNDGLYSYSFDGSPNLPSSYSGSENTQSSTSLFQMKEVLNSCTISSISELELYIAQLATSYQSLASYDQYEDLIFNFNSLGFKKNMSKELELRWVEIESSVLTELNEPIPNIIFIDTFTGTNGSYLIGGHTPNSPGSWDVIWANNTAYSISGNMLTKDNSSLTLIYSTPNPIITNPDYNVSFDVQDFSWWNISIYLRYVDNDNYYRLDINSSWYVIMRRMAWIDATIQTISDPINLWDSIIFAISWSTINFSIWGIEKENILDFWGLSATWLPLILLQNAGATIDDYRLIYK